MRITKVKIKLDNKLYQVTMQKEEKYGTLKLNEESRKSTAEILRLKKASFNKSFHSKTINSQKENKNATIKKNGDYISQIFEKLVGVDTNKNIRKPKMSLTDLKDLPKKDLALFIKRKFKNDDIVEIKNLDLISLFYNALQKVPGEHFTDESWADFCQEMMPYREYKNKFIERKIILLANSIEQNKGFSINPETFSKRKRVLHQWAIEVQERGDFSILDEKLSKLAEIYNFKKMCKRVQDELNDLEKSMKKGKNPEKEKEAYKKQKNFKIKTIWKDYPYKTHIGLIEKIKENEELNQFNIEIGKYFEHYFPIKKERCTEDEPYYLNSETIATTVNYQLKNALISYLMQIGKYKQFGLENQVLDSKKLQEIGIYEGFQTKFMDACVFATSSLKNIIEPMRSGDILGKREFKEAIATSSFVNYHHFFPYFPFELKGMKDRESELIPFGEQTEAKQMQNIWALRGSVQQIRNEIFHSFDKNQKFNLPQLDKSNFEFDASENSTGKSQSYIETDYKFLFEAEKNQLEQFFIERIKSSGALEYYPLKSLEKLFAKKEMKFSLGSQVVAFAPSYKKLVKKGHSYQTATEGTANYLGLSYYNRYELKEESFQAQYYLLKLIYQYVFLPNFSQGNSPAFRETVKAILRINKDEARKKMKKNKKFLRKYAFEQVREMEFKETPDQYMSYLQSEMREEKVRKAEKNDKGFEKNITMNFEKLLMQIFVKGFDVFLTTFAGKELLLSSEEKVIKETEISLSKKINEREKTLKASIQVEHQLVATNSAISYWLFCKLLDSRHLNELRNEMIKFKQSRIKFNHTQHAELIQNLLPIVELTILSNDYDEKNDSQNVDVSAYFEDKSLYETAPYVQTDDRTRVSFRPILKLEKYHTKSLIEALLKDNPQFRVAATDIQEWMHKREEIGELVEKRKNLHTEWAEGQQTLGAEKREEYRDYCKKIDRFNWKANKVTLTYLSQLHYLITDLLGRMVGFSALFERDLVYFSRSFSELGGETYHISDYKNLSGVLRLNAEVKPIKIKNIKVIDNEENPYKGNEPEVKPFLDRLHAYLENVIGIKAVHGKIRNQTAHLSVLQLELSMIESMNNLRDLMAYDRKLKNAVTKSMIKILDKHGMILKLKIDENHKNFEIESLIPKEIIHLKDKAIKTNQVSEEYCQLVLALLTTNPGNQLN
ncbi:type VI-A CRISPR-associated RNA-guided ribonuclease Cas13a [Carnobacterium gallinarum]|uniref:type VI-A CRISPR-associated RNA-guided ribonuclease Cas13a n=1 Tax=Carnobacterium gallinarum TaxID=2749 RepID=UPI000550AC54|nr:type VI-A CRISPR-associated RNA-guided ribonuclease Cas13a [Carnobacterium gallinarum]